MTDETPDRHPQTDRRALRLLCALDLMEFGIAVMRQNIVRRRPQASPAAIDAELQEWISSSGGSELKRKPA